MNKSFILTERTIYYSKSEFVLYLQFYKNINNFLFSITEELKVILYDSQLRRAKINQRKSKIIKQKCISCSATKRIMHKHSFKHIYQKERATNIQTFSVQLDFNHSNRAHYIVIIIN